jgi:SAM-dependent methyltransferase
MGRRWPQLSEPRPGAIAACLVERGDRASRWRPPRDRTCRAMVDRLFSDPVLAALYDTFGAGRRDFGFYLPIAMSAQSVLDVGCGTGALLHAAREAGHNGRLCGLDPADGMLQQARKRSDIEWILGDLGGITWDRQFDLVLMTGHAFQVFIEDNELRVGLAAIRSALTPGGRLAFETRNPLVRGWETWTPENAASRLWTRPGPLSGCHTR